MGNETFVDSVLLVGAAFFGAFASSAANIFLKDWLNLGNWFSLIIVTIVFIGLAYALLKVAKKVRK